MSTGSDAPLDTPQFLAEAPADDGIDTQPPADDVLRFGLPSDAVVPIVALIAAITSALGSHQPTGNALADVLLPFVFGGVVVLLGHRAPAVAIMASAILALFFTGLQMPAVIMGIFGLAAAFFLTSFRRLDRESWAISAAVCAGFVSQTVLHLPSIGFMGSASVMAAIAVAPLLIGGYVQLDGAAKRWARIGIAATAFFAIAGSALAVFAAVSVQSDIEVAIEEARDGIDALEDGDRPAALTLLDSSEDGFAQAADTLSGPMTWPARFIPVTAQHSRALETAADQGAALAATAGRTADRADVERIRGQNGEIDLDVIEEVNIELNRANATILGARQSLDEVASPWLVPQLRTRIDEVQEELATTGEDIDLATHATAVMPGVLGSDGTRRYLVLFVQPAESREFGGFVGAYGLVEIDQGRFQLVESGGIDVDFGEGVAQFADPTLFPESYVRVAPQINPQNLTGVADLQTIADAARELSPQWREDPDFAIDGVITLDPYALAGMLELTGPLTVPGREAPVDATNVVDFLLRDQYIDFENDRDTRQDSLRALAADAFSRLFSIEIPGPERLGNIFGPAARANRLSMATFDEEENLFFDRVFLSADFPVVGDAVDMVGIFSQTGRASKLDGYGSRSSVYEVTVNPETGEVQSRLTMTETNDAPEGAGTFVLGKPGQRGPTDEPLASGTNYLATGLYTRAEVEAVTSTTPYDDTRDPMDAFSYTRHMLLFEVPQGGEAIVTVDMTQTVEPGRYDVFIPAQAAANVGDFTLVIRPTEGWRVDRPAAAADGSWSRTFPSDEARAFRFTFVSN